MLVIHRLIVIHVKHMYRHRQICPGRKDIGGQDTLSSELLRCDNTVPAVAACSYQQMVRPLPPRTQTTRLSNQTQGKMLDHFPYFCNSSTSLSFSLPVLAHPRHFFFDFLTEGVVHQHHGTARGILPPPTGWCSSFTSRMSVL